MSEITQFDVPAREHPAYCSEAFTQQCFAPAFDFRDGGRVDLPHQFGLETQFGITPLGNYQSWMGRASMEQDLLLQYWWKRFGRNPPRSVATGILRRRDTPLAADKLPDIDTSEHEPEPVDELPRVSRRYEQDPVYRHVAQRAEWPLKIPGAATTIGALRRGTPLPDELGDVDIDTGDEPTDEDKQGILRWLLNHVLRQQVPSGMWE